MPVRLPEDLHRKFKATCALNGENMNGVLLRLIEGYVRESEKKQTKKK